jgi:hypothetical protein
VREAPAADRRCTNNIPTRNPSNQTAEVGGEVCRSAHDTVDEVVEEEDSCRLGDAPGNHWIERAPLYQQKAEQRAVQAEDSARGACADGHRMDPYADQTPKEACAEVDDQVACASEDRFNEWPNLVEHIHIERRYG